jgi:hypothetical protein
MQPGEHLEMSSADGKREHEDTWDPLTTWASMNRGGHATYDNGEVERTGSGNGEGTTGASVVIEGDGESNGSLGDGGRECDGNTSHL